MKPRPNAYPAALAFIGKGRHDVRPDLVALYYGDVWTNTPKILTYGHAYLVGWCARRQLMFRDDVMRAATAHGLLRLCRPIAAQSVETRAKECRIRAGTFRLLSDAAFDVFRARLGEGAVAFLKAAANSEDPAPASTILSVWAESTWWNRVEAGRRNRGKLLELEVGSSLRPPASDRPRAPYRDNGWLPNFDWAARSRLKGRNFTCWDTVSFRGTLCQLPKLYGHEI